MRLGGILLLCLMLTACGKVDDYILGKDNVPKPKSLSTFSERVTFQERWNVGVGIKSNVPTALALYQDTLYVVAATGEIQARRAQDGQLIWETQTHAELSGKMNFSRGVMILGTRDAKVLAVNRKNGKQLWEKSLSGAVLATPVVTGQQVVVKTVNGVVYALNLQNGQRLWYFQHGAPELILKASSAPLIIPQSHLVLVAYADGKLDALDLASGNLIWQKGLVYGVGANDIERLVDIDSDLILQRQMVLLATYQGIVGAFSLQTGDLVWQKKASVIQNMDLAKGALYVTDAQDVVWSLHPDNGQVNWKQAGLKARSLTEPVWTASGIVLGDKTGLVHLLSNQDGAPIGRTMVKGAVAAAPIVQGRQVFILSRKGELYAFNLSTQPSLRSANPVQPSLRSANPVQPSLRSANPVQPSLRSALALKQSSPTLSSLRSALALKQSSPTLSSLRSALALKQSSDLKNG